MMSIERGLQSNVAVNHPVRPIAPAIKEQHGQQQAALNNLNDRMKNYVQRVVQLEETNKKLQSELDNIRNGWGKETKEIIEKMEPELAKKREKVDDLSRDAASSVVKGKRLDYEIGTIKQNLDDEMNFGADDREKIRNLEHLLEQNQHELDLLKHRIEEKEDDLQKYAGENNRLNDELKALLNDLDLENLKGLQLRNENQTMEEQIPFLKAIHEQELNEMRRLNDPTKKDPSQFYRMELERAIRDIRNDFEQLNLLEKQDLDNWYKDKAEEIKKLSERREPDELPKILETNKGLKNTVNAQNSNIKDFGQDQQDLIKKLNDLEDKLEKERNDHVKKINDQDKEIAERKKAIRDYLNDLDHLLHNKGDVESEINTLKRLLDSSNAPESPKKSFDDITCDELTMRLEREKAKTGGFHVSIAWNNINDLDLHVIEPSGEEISFSHRKSATGGELDVDMNAGSQRNEKPVENIYWPKGNAPHGHYKVLIVYYSNHGGSDPTSFLCVAEMFGKQFEFRGKMAYGDKPNVFEFDV